MTNRILLVSTYKKLSKIAKRLSKEINLDLDIYEGGVNRNGHLYAKSNENLYDVIISNGGTAEVITNLVSIPVISVSPGIVDYLEAINKANSYGKKIGLVVFKSGHLSYIESIKKMIDIDFKILPYANKEELELQIQEAINLGISTIIGMGDCILKKGKKYNLKTVIVHNNEVQIREALMSARNISDLARREMEKTDKLKKIIDYSGEGIISLDKNGTIMTFNPMAERIFNLNSSQVLKQPIHKNFNSEFVDEIFDSDEMLTNKLVNIGDKQFTMNRLPIVIEERKISIIMTFQEVSKTLNQEPKAMTPICRKGLVTKYNFSDICGDSMEIKNTIKHAKKIGKTDATVLINGETGTGKELFAQSIHNISPRKEGPFVAINCATMLESLLESELFGYEEGAFTGAKKGGKLGLFELANGGTIFLDEISEMPLRLQGRLLRVLQEKEVIRVGGDCIHSLDIRIISATNANLYKMVKEGEFRKDLYFRLNVLDLRIPPLRERKSDIPMLVRNFIEEINFKNGTNISDISVGAMKLLEQYNWPGNIRQLKNFTEKMCLLSDNNIINEAFINKLFYNHNAVNDKIELHNDENVMTVNLGSLREVENQVIKQANEIFKGDKMILAEKLGISRTTLWKRLKEIEKDIS